MAEHWTGRKVLITGASSGIGAALARELAGVGAVIGMCARRTALLDEVLDDCRSSVPACRAWTVDLSDLGAIDAFAGPLADSPDPRNPVPAPVVAREIRRQLERGDLELYVPHQMRGQVVRRARDVTASVAMMADWYRSGAAR